MTHVETSPRELSSSSHPSRLPIMSPSPVTGDKFAFSLPKHIWEEYIKFRPPYPDSMFQMWLDYHAGPLDAIHDLGTGCGVGAAGLLRAARAARGGAPVPLAVLSDPNANNVAAARALLAAADPSPGTRLVLHQQPGEAAFLAPGSVDMVVACECLHWTAIGACVAAVRASLRAGGTFAAVLYDPSTCAVAGDPAATAALARVYEAMVEGTRAGRHTLRLGAMTPDELYCKWRPCHALNMVPLDPAEWEDVRRVYINIEDGLREWPSAPILRKLAGADSKGSKVNEKTERLEWIQDAEGWGVKDCTVDWVRGMLLTMMIEFDDAFWEEPPWTDFVASTAKNGGKFCSVFGVNYIMARKK